MDPVAEFLRHERDRLVALWVEEARRELPSLQHMTGPVLIDHLFELLEALAAWIEGHHEAAERGFDALVEGHALQRLGYGVGLETLIREYSKLRFIVLRELLAVDAPRASLLLLHAGMDRAIGAAIDRYASRREEIRNRFISILGHDLRDPLSTISISTDILSRDGAATDQQRSIVSRMQRACDRMQRMVGEVLDFARGHLGGGIPVNPSLHDMAEICHQVADEIGVARPGRTITLDVAGDLRGAFDRDRVAQALGNLVSNGLDHGTGSVEVRAREADDKMHVITQITSHGKPIPPEVLPRLFDPFARGEGATARGLGLGLYIVQQIALAHGATCDVESNPQATTFTITWPRVPDEARLAAAKS